LSAFCSRALALDSKATFSVTNKVSLDLRIPEDEKELNLEGEILVPLVDLCEKQLQTWKKTSSLNYSLFCDPEKIYERQDLTSFFANLKILKTKKNIERPVDQSPF
jgi:hypothetical protein